jgi:glutamate-ammonia-ligase adenylyltransferase
MALTRARVVVAGDGLRAELEGAIRAALTAPRDQDVLLRDVADMRGRIERDRPSAGAWDVKNMRGGLVDVEFLAQYLQLRHAAANPEVLARNTTEALRRLCDAGLIDEATTGTLTDAMRLWRNVQGVLRLSVGENFDEAAVSEGCRAFVARVCGRENFLTLREEIADTAARCHAIFRKMIEDPARDLPPAEQPSTG